MHFQNDPVKSSLYPSSDAYEMRGSIGSIAVAINPKSIAATQEARKTNVQAIDAANGRMGVTKKRNCTRSAGRTNHVLICILECGDDRPLRRFAVDILSMTNER